MTALVSTPELLVERRGDVVVLTMNRPAKLNAVDPAMVLAIAAAAQETEADASVRVVVLTGTGDRAFSAGGDLGTVAEGRASDLTVEPGGFAGLVQLERSKPWIAAVNGFALGGGCELVLACDLVLAVPGATFALPEVTRGVVACEGGVFRLSRWIPPARAMELVLTGDSLGAAEAQTFGLVNHVVAPEDLVDEAVQLGQRIAQGSPEAVRSTLALARASVRTGEAELWAMSHDVYQRVSTSEDAIEGARAFAERRAPIWTGK